MNLWREIWNGREMCQRRVVVCVGLCTLDQNWEMIFLRFLEKFPPQQLSNYFLSVLFVYGEQGFGSRVRVRGAGRLVS